MEGTCGHDAFRAAPVVAIVVGDTINTPPPDRGKLNCFGRWLAGQALAVQVAIRFARAVAVGAALFGFYYWLGMSREWALALAIFVVFFLSVLSIPRQRTTTGLD